MSLASFIGFGRELRTIFETDERSRASGSRCRLCRSVVRSPHGSSLLLGADEIARGVAKRAVAHSPRLRRRPADSDPAEALGRDVRTDLEAERVVVKAQPTVGVVGWDGYCGDGDWHAKIIGAPARRVLLRSCLVPGRVRRPVHRHGHGTRTRARPPAPVLAPRASAHFALLHAGEDPIGHSTACDALPAAGPRRNTYLK
jgi:hypothetical protein